MLSYVFRVFEFRVMLLNFKRSVWQDIKIIGVIYKEINFGSNCMWKDFPSRPVRAEKGVYEPANQMITLIIRLIAEFGFEILVCILKYIKAYICSLCI